MTRNLYFLGIFFMTLSALAILFQGVLFFRMGMILTYQQSFADWLLASSIVSLIAALVCLRYYQHKNYRSALWIGAVYIVIGWAEIILFYIILIKVIRTLDVYYIVLSMLSLISSLVCGLNLIFSNTGKRPWLKAAGVTMVIINVTTLLLRFGSFLLTDVQMQHLILRAAQWTAIFFCVPPVLFLMNFWSEVRTLKREETTATLKEGVLIFISMTSLIFVFVLASKLSDESYWSMDWERRSQDVARQLARPFEDHAYVGRKGDTLRYLFMQPLDYNPQTKYPLVVCLHGGGPNRKPGNIEVTEPATVLTSYENRKKYPAFIFVPQAPVGKVWGGFSSAPTVDLLVFETINSLEREFAIDKKRRYVAGISGGGYGSWHFICTRPEMFAAAVPICGAGDPTLAKKIVNVPVWAFHGDADRNVPVSGSRDMIEAIKMAGGNPRYSEFPGVGHNVWPKVNETPGLLDWLFAQKRD